MSDNRRNPEKLLHRAQEEERKEKRGKLKIYLGAAPGVGKTHEMLQDALEELDKGLDVVVGIVESHGRTEIIEMLNEFDILSRQEVEYHARKLFEFDLDAALKRNPGLILMDEMAHTNAPGLRHDKRWQDIKELLDRGVNVWTTLNVQHIESLNDDVAQIIHAPVKETVPDSMIELADTIELVDLPPDELLKRLKEGKVYFPQQAAFAAENFFRKGNLIALRELALRVTAERVGADVLLYRQGEGIKHIWPVRDKILVCVGPKPESLQLIRAAKRIANSLQAEWIAVYVDTPQLQSSEDNRNNAIKKLRLAEQLGAETRILAGFDMVNELLNFAHERNVTQIMIWKNIRSRWRAWFFRDLANELVKKSGEIDVYIMTGEPVKTKPVKLKEYDFHIPWRSYLLSIGIVILTTFINFMLYPYLASSNVIMVYLLGVTLVALIGGTGPSILASLLSVLAYSFFFIEPYYNIIVTNIEYLFTLVVMLLVSQVISYLTILIRRQAESARKIQHQTSILYTLSRKLSNARGVDKLLDIGTHYLSETFNSHAVGLLPTNSHLEIHTIHQTENSLDPKEMSIAQWVYELGQMAGFGTDTLSFSKALYVPLLASQGTIGVLRILPNNNQFYSPEDMHLIESFANQIALAIEVDRLQDQKRKNELLMQSDGLYTTLLQSISHDLRTPLISVIASASTLIEVGETLDIGDIKKIATSIYSETEQLNRLINNLLQITYLESTNVKIRKISVPLKEIIDHVINISAKKLMNRKVNINLAEDVPLILCDNSLIEEVLINLIDNAIKFTPPESPITIQIDTTAYNVIVSIEDRGPGIMPDEVNKLFEKYYRGRQLTTERGLGLGLAICKMIIELHGGDIWAVSNKETGATFRFSLPISG